MENTKKSFLIYLDNYPMLMELPPEQRGWLLTALCVYSDRVCRDETVSMEEILDQFPQLTSQGRVACRFMGSNILRDTQRWLSQQQSRAQRHRGQDGPAAPRETEREAERVRRDMEATRKLVERIRAAEDEAL